MRETWTFHSAGQVIFGPGAVRQLGEVVQRLRLERLLIVTDPALIEVGLLDDVLGPLGEACVRAEVFPGGEPEPALRVAENAIAQAREFQPDGVIGLGGGSNMDLAKITATVLAHGGAARDYIGEDRIPGPVLPVVCIPTTAGTGSEVTASGVLTDSERDLKVGFLSNFLRPRAALSRDIKFCR